MNRLIAGIEPSPIDQRDYVYISPFTPEQINPIIDLRYHVFEIEDQETIGSCVANGVCSQCEVIGNQHNNVTDLSRMFLYNATKAFEGRLGQSGLYTRNAYKVAYKYGIAPESDYPYDLSKDDIYPPENIYQIASERRVEKYEAVVRSGITDGDGSSRIHRIASALQEGLVVGIGLPVTQSLYNLTGPWHTHSYKLASQDKEIGGHYMYIVGHDANRRMFIVANSWGTDWGDGGYCGMPYSIVDEIFFEAYVVRNFDGMEIKEEPGIKLEYVNRFRMHARIVPKPHEIGQTVKVWAGGIINGQAYMKPPVQNRELFLGNQSDMSGGTDAWIPAGQSGFLPVLDDYVIKEDNPLRIISWRDLRPLAGGDIYVAYGDGDNLYTATLEKICTIPQL